MQFRPCARIPLPHSSRRCRAPCWIEDSRGEADVETDRRRTRRTRVFVSGGTVVCAREPAARIGAGRCRTFNDQGDRWRMAAAIRRARWRGSGHLSAADRELAGSAADADRKSTRLNSSHVEISYAVFCLKKKKKKNKTNHK